MYHVLLFKSRRHLCKGSMFMRTQSVGELPFRVTATSPRERERRLEGLLRTTMAVHNSW